MTFKIVCKKSQKGNEYIALVAVRNDKETVLTFDVNTIVRATGYSHRELYTLDVGESINL